MQHHRIPEPVRSASLARAVVCAGLVAVLGASPLSAYAEEVVATTPAATAVEAPATADAVTDPAAATATDDAAQHDAAATTESALAAQAAPQQDAPVTQAAASGVARIDDVSYDTFDAAVVAAKSGDTVTLVADAQTAGLDMAVGKTITIDGAGHTLTFVSKGIALRAGAHLTFTNVVASMTGVGATPASDFGWTWMSVCAQADATLTLDGASLTMDGTNAGNAHAIYFTGNNKLNLKNGSDLTIKNYKQDALEWDGGDGGYNVNIEDGSTFTSDRNRSGFTGTFTVTVDNSKVNVVNSTGNGSNGSHFDIRNGSVVDFSNNAVHGLSAGNLSVSNSTVKASGNGYNGIIFTGKGAFEKANVQVTGTKGKSYWNAGVRLLKANASLDVDADSTVSITGNQVTGLFLDAGARATFADGAALIITGNDASQANCTTKMDLAQMGGGVVVRTGASLVLPDTASIHNNNATLAGDDLYVEKDGIIAFGDAANGSLTEFDGCGHRIDGWYEDGADARWSAHGETLNATLAESGSHAGEFAAKAAHGLARVGYAYVGAAPSAAQLPDADEGLELGSAYTAKTQDGVDGWTFDGWYTDETCTTKWADGTTLDGSMTLYGKWSESAKPEPAPQPKPQDHKPVPMQTTKTTKGDLPQTGDVALAAAPLALAGSVALVAGGVAAARRKDQ